MKTHSVFHVSLLKLAGDDPYPGEIQTPLPPVVVNGEESYQVEYVLNSSMKWRGLETLVQWIRYAQPD